MPLAGHAPDESWHRRSRRVRTDFLSTRNLRDYLAPFTAVRDGRQDLVPKGHRGLTTA